MYIYKIESQRESQERRTPRDMSTREFGDACVLWGEHHWSLLQNQAKVIISISLAVNWIVVVVLLLVLSLVLLF